MPGGRLTAVLLFDVRTQRANRSVRFLETLLTQSRAKLDARGIVLQIARNLLFLFLIITCACIYIYISLRWLLNDTIMLGWRDRAGRWNGLNSSLKVSLRDLYCYGCVFVRSTAEGSMLNRTKCIAIAKLSRNYSRGGRIISQWGVLPCSYRFLVVRSRVSGSR